MFSVTITQDGEKDFAWPVTYVRMVYALGVEGVELEYAKVTIA